VGEKKVMAENVSRKGGERQGRKTKLGRGGGKSMVRSRIPLRSGETEKAIKKKKGHKGCRVFEISRA